MKFAALLAAVIYVLPALAQGSSTTPAAISTGPSPTINTPIASGSVISSTTSGAAVSSAATAAPYIVLESASSVTICQQLTFTWTFNGPSNTPLTLVVTNEQEFLPVTVFSNQSQPISHTLTDYVSSDAGTFVWNPVDVPIGLYVLAAFNSIRETNITLSPPFFVLPGLDESCLDPNPTPTPSASSSSSANTDGSGAASQSLDAQHKTMSSGAIAGIVIGSVAGVALLAFAIFFPRWWAKRVERLRPSEGPYAKF